MVTLQEHIKVFYCNGINTDSGNAKLEASYLLKTLQSPRIHLHYNNGNIDQTFVTAITTLSTLVGLLVTNVFGTILFGIGGFDLSLRTVEQRKRMKGAELAWKIEQHLLCDEKNQIFLIGYSQGRDVIDAALGFLETYKSRIVVLTIGSQPIATDRASRVVNVIHTNDPIPTYMNVRNIILWKSSDGKSSYYLLPVLNKFKDNTHSFIGYLSNPFVTMAMRHCQQDLINRVRLLYDR